MTLDELIETIRILKEQYTDVDFEIKTEFRDIYGDYSYYPINSIDVDYTSKTIYLLT